MEDYKTLIDVIKAQSNNDAEGITFINKANDEKYVSYKSLYKNAHALLQKLFSSGIKPQNELVFQLSNNETFITTLWACFIGGIIPVPVTVGTNDESYNKMFKVWKTLNNPYLIINDRDLQMFRKNSKRSLEEITEKTIVVDEIMSLNNYDLEDSSPDYHTVKDDDIAFIQFSSGSTGDPKGVVLTHRNLLTNIRSIAKCSNITKDDSFLNWMPLTHDMGLIGNHLTPIAVGINLYLMSTDLFIRRPLLWMEKTSQHNATILSSPNFGYKYYLDALKRKKPKKVDLSSVRLIMNGAEPISKKLCDEFLDTMVSYKLNKRSMFTVYGLAEASVAVTFPKPGEKMKSVNINRNLVNVGQKIEHIDEDYKDSMTLMMLGEPIENTKVRIVDNEGKELPSEHIGNIEIYGLNVTSGYYNNKIATEKIMSEDGWLNTGDIGFFKDGCLVVTGRAKDIIFVNGQNFYSHDLERILQSVEGIELKKIVSVGIYNQNTGEDDILLFVVFKKSDFKEFLNISQLLKEKIASQIGLKVSHVIPIKRIPKTTSGKVQRYMLADNYKKGMYDSVIKQLKEISFEMKSIDRITDDSDMGKYQNITRDRIIDLIQEQLELILGFRVSDHNKSLMEMGINSIKVPKLQSLLEKTFGIELPVTIAFDYPTLNKMADYIFERFMEKKLKDNRQIFNTNDSLNNEYYNGKVAVIGMGCRFPGEAVSPEKFWNVLKNGIDTMGTVPISRWDVKKYYHPSSDAVGKMYTKSGAFVEGIDKFDAAFFGITPVEAEKIDPQQRLLLEVSMEAMEESGLDIMGLQGSKTGVFIGISTNEYLGYVDQEGFDKIEGYTLTGSMLSTASGRISYTFGFNGPSMSIDTACSSSLVAVHQAVTSLNAYQSDMALAGGVNLIISPKGYIGLSRLNALSPQGRCKTFDDSADGYARGEGCGIIILKRLSDAIRDGDNILALITGSAINHDGKSSGLTVPNGVAQENVVKDALKQAGLSASNIDYIEAHGTGTKLGDPQEINALSNVFTSSRAKDKKLMVGSVKTNIGHLESAAGIAGVIKVILALNKERIPKHLHYNVPNRFINWDKMMIEVTDREIEWNRTKNPRTAGVSSFGLSGTNSHIILQEAPIIKQKEANKASRPYHILTFSAKNGQALNEYALKFKDYLLQSEESIENICYTSNVCKTSYGNRFAVVGETKEDFVKKLERFSTNNDILKTNKKTDKRIAFMFTGQGSQYIGMGQELYETQCVFRDAIEECSTLFDKYLEKSIIDLLYTKNNPEDILERTEYTQPVIFSIEYALMKLWESYNVKPSIVVGHSIGQYMAAYAAGIFTLEDAVKLVAIRGKLMQTMHGKGKMIAVFESEDKLKDIIRENEFKNEEVSIAAINSPQNISVAGTVEAIYKLQEILSQRGIMYKQLKVSYGFHSASMAPVVERFKEVTSKVTYSMPQIPIVADITGEIVTNDKLSHPDYWNNHIVDTVRFYDAVRTIETEGYEILIEVGSHSVLSGIASECMKNERAIILPSLRYRKGDWEQLLNTIGELYTNGININWDELNKYYSKKKVMLPTYPFQRKKYWKYDVEVGSGEVGLGDMLSNKSGEEYQLKSNSVRRLGMDKIKSKIKEIIYSVSGIDTSDIGEDESLFALGLDSLMLVKIKKQIDNEFKMDIALNKYFEQLNTVAKIAKYLNENTCNNISEAMEEVAITVETSSMSNTDSRSTLVAEELKSTKRLEEEAFEKDYVVDEYKSMGLESTIGKVMDMQMKTMSKSIYDLAAKQLEVLKTTTESNVKSISSYGNEHIEKNQFEPKIKEPKKRPDYPKVNIRSIKLEEDELTVKQRKFIDDLIYSYNKRTQKSKSYEEKYRYTFSHWLTSLNFRMTLKELIYPLIAKEAEGGYFWDIDGNKYLDLALGYGVHFFGHKPEFVIEAIENQVKKGFVLSPHSELIGEAAELICELTGVDRVNFCNTGSEAVMAAMRIARTVTNRKKIVRFAGSYHGIYDGVLAEADDYGTFPLASGIMEGAVEDIIVLGYGSPDSLDKIKELGSELAAVLVEPVQSRRPGIQPKEFLVELRKITEEIGATLIFDEMITGFRIHPGGAQKHFGVQADIVTYGKIVGGGMPIGVVAGKKEYLDAVDGGFWNFGDKSWPQKEVTFIAGTFANHPITISSLHAVLEHMKAHGSSLHDRLNDKVKNFADTLNIFFKKENIPIRIKHFGSLFRFESFGRYDLALMPIEMDLFFYILMYKGIYTWERRVNFFSTVHTDDDFEFIIRSVKDTIRELRAGGFPFVASEDKALVQGSIKESGDNVYPMSTAQKRFFVLNHISEYESAVHLPYPILIHGALDKERVEQVFKEIVKRHEGLRTGFTIREQEMVQLIHDDVDFQVEYKKAHGSNIEELVHSFIKPFNLIEPPLIHVGIAELNEKLSLLFIDLHHIIADGLSANIVAQDFVKLYSGQVLSPVNMQYKDYVYWKNNYYMSREFEQQEKYWIEKFSGELPVLNLPIDYKRMSERNVEGNTLQFVLDKTKTEELKNFAKDNETSLYMLLMAMYNVLLSKLSGQNEIIIGTPIAVRGQGEFDETVGLLTNTVPLRINIDDGETFVDFLNAVKKNCIEAYGHSDYPFEDLVDKLNIGEALSRHPLFDAMFIYENANDRVMTIDNLIFEALDFDYNTSIFDFTFEVIEAEGNLNINWYYSTQLFKKSTIDKWKRYFLIILEQVLYNKDTIISDFLKENEEELKQLILDASERNKVDYQSARPLHKNDENIYTEVEDLDNVIRVHIAEKEKKIVDIFTEVLGIATVDINANFFEMGGRSLTAITLVEEMQKEFKVNMMDLFKYTTIAQLAKNIPYREDIKNIKVEHKESNRPLSQFSNDEMIHKNQVGIESTSTKSEGDIAIVGLSAKFPGAKDVDEFWENLRDGRESISFFTHEELLEEGIEEGLLRNPNYIKAKGIMDDLEYFDASFFDYSPKEAELMEPQIRVFHECAWKALEDAGYDPERCQDRIGVYAGSAHNFSWVLKVFNSSSSPTEQIEKVALNDKDFLSTRISYKLDLKGPSYTVQTACSSSLVSIHLACQALRSGECDMALAGGVSVMLPKKGGYLYHEGMILSPDGHCRAFDEKAQGTLFSDGVGIVVLKPLNTAIADGDHVYAVIKGTAVNNDGKRKVGFTAPSIQGQIDVIKSALTAARVNPQTITYVEAHGTGTNIGDPIEIEALKDAFCTSKKGFCAIGSVKTNVGHLDAAAGVAGLIKTILALKNKEIPPSLNFEKPNPKIDFENSPFYVNTELKEWTRMIDKERQEEYIPLRAGVSSFGFGGTNAHVILEESPEIIKHETEKDVDKPRVIALSTKTKSTIDKATENLVQYLRKNPDSNLSDITYTLQMGRSQFKNRRILVCESTQEAFEVLSTVNDESVQTSKKIYSNSTMNDNRKIVFMFTGQGSQYIDMGLDIYKKEPAFKKEMDRCFEIINEIVDYDIKNIIYPIEDKDKKRSEINQTHIAQLSIFSIEYSLARLLIQWGVHPDYMIGHSIGEYVAACISGVLSLRDALALVAVRGKLMQEMAAGAMMSVNASAKDLQLLINDNISIAAINSESNCVVSGSYEAIDEFEQLLKENGYDVIKLKTSHAFHSMMMEPILHRFEEAVGKVKLSKPIIPYISNVTGNWIEFEEILNPKYWSKHLRDTVMFASGLETLMKEPNMIFVEVGAGKTLSTLARQNKSKKDVPTILNTMRHYREEICDYRYLLDKVGVLWCEGVNIDWKKLYIEETRKRISLPTYPFKGQKFSIDGVIMDTVGTEDDSKKLDLEEWFYIPTWKTQALEKDSNKVSESSWLLLVDEFGLGEGIANNLRLNDQSAIIVKPGKECEKLQEDVYIINPYEPESYEWLFNELKSLGNIPDGIVHMWNVCDVIDNPYVDNTRFSDIELPFYSIMYLVQAIGNIDAAKMTRLFIISNNMQSVTGEDIVYPQKSTLIGLCKNIPQEYTNISCRSIDIGNISSIKRNIHKLVQELYNEISSKVVEVLVAYRGNLRFVEEYQSLKIDDSPYVEDRLKEKGVYMITGGTGGIGFVLAEYLAKNYKARLVLIGRSSFPGKDQWEKWVGEYGEEDATSRKIRKVQELEKHGSEVIVAGANVASFEEIYRVTKDAEELFGSINGVIHAAGVPGVGAIQSKTKESANNVFLSKAEGTLTLDKVFDNRVLDFFLICSSMASIVSAIGQADYASANAFVDGYIKYKNSIDNKTFTACINWDTWSDVGMTVKAAEQYDYLSLSEELKKAILPEEGKLAFEKVMRCLEPQVLVTTRDLKGQLNKLYNASDYKRMREEGNKKLGKHLRPELSNDYVPPSNEIEEKLAKMWSEVLGVDQIGIYDDFNELGGDSLTAITLVSTMQKEFTVDITEIFKYPTIAELAKKVSNRSINLESKIEEAKIEFYRYIDSQEKAIEETKPAMEEYISKNMRYENLNIKDTKEYSNILLLGSTGYLGTYLLKELLDKTTAKIYTIVRDTDIKSAKERVRDKMSFSFKGDIFSEYADRIIVIKGEITEDKFNLNNKEYEKLTKTIDCVINSAAKVAHYGKYEDFYKINIETVERIVQFVRDGIEKDIHHISTKAVALGKIDGKDNALFTEYDYDMGQKIDNYYVETKKEAEKIIKNARAEGINASIYRVGDIAFDSRNGRFQENIDENFVYLLIRSFSKLGYVPELNFEFFDFAFVDYVSEAIIKLLTRSSLNNEVFHILNPNGISLKEFLEMSKGVGMDVKGMEFGEFMGYLHDNYDNKEMKPYIKDFIVHSHVLETKNHTNFILETKKTTSILKKMGFSWKRPTDEHFKRMLDYGKEVGFFA